MIRRMLGLAAALLAGGCSDAPADLRAHYAVGGRAGGLVVQVAANGDARIDSLGETLIRRAGTDYLILSDAQGGFSATVADLADVTAELRKPGIDPPTPAPGAASRFDLVRAGEGVVAGHRGERWLLRPIGGRETGLEAIVSTDPELAPIGRAFISRFAQEDPGAGPDATRPDGMRARMLELLGKGTLLQFGPLYRLETVERTRIAPAQFVPPEPVLDRAGLIARARPTGPVQER